ncbi:MAG TPA: hypothetical protein PKM20_07770 [Nitrosomonas sp.]|nr:hypothetical protein [Nitrosomonas sp.]HNP26623.1 hypothetical protein [Nitrosomonas sp.]
MSVGYNLYALMQLSRETVASWQPDFVMASGFGQKPLSVLTGC